MGKLVTFGLGIFVGVVATLTIIELKKSMNKTDTNVPTSPVEDRVQPIKN